MTSPLENASFKAWHEREMAQLTTMLVAAAGGQIKVSRDIADKLPSLLLGQVLDHATGDMIFTTDEDVKAFNDSFKEVQK